MKASDLPARRKRKTRDDILAAGAKLLRRNGIRGASVSKVMDEAGLTVGGFYAHFKSKEDLVAQAFRRALEDSGRTVAALPPSLTGARKLRAFVKEYLSLRHRDRDKRGEGCPLAALTGEMGKGPAGLQRVFSAELETIAAQRAALFSDAGFRLAPKDYLAILATCIGGLTLARATRGHPLSELILGACRASLDATISQREDEHA